MSQLSPQAPSLSRQTHQGLRKEVVWIGFGSLILLLGVQWISYLNTMEMGRTHDQLYRTKTINESLEILFSHVKDLENSVRGYAITDDPEFLKPYHTAYPLIDKDLYRLKSLVKDKRPVPHIAHLEELVHERVRRAETVLAVQKRHGKLAAQALIAGGIGQHVMVPLRTRIDIIRQIEDTILREQEKRAADTAVYAQIIFWSGLALIIILQATAYYLTSREMKERMAAETKIRGLNEELSNHIQELDKEIEERKRLEEKTSQLNRELAGKVTLLNESNASLNAVNQELESFAYSVSHDLRAPLRGIDGLSKAVLMDYEDRLDDMGKRYLAQLRQESQRMGQLIDDVLRLSRLTRGEMKKEPVNLSAIAKETLAMLKSQDPHRNVQVTIEEDMVVEADPRLMQSVIQNLLENAWKFTSKKETAEIFVGTAERDGKKVYCVKDNGAGFDMAYVHKLFGTFQRLHGMTEYTGTGVGLATVKRIINRHGGHVWAEGKLNEGAAFYFTLDSQNASISLTTDGKDTHAHA